LIQIYISLIQIGTDNKSIVKLTFHFFRFNVIFAVKISNFELTR